MFHRTGSGFSRFEKEALLPVASFANNSLRSLGSVQQVIDTLTDFQDAKGQNSGIRRNKKMVYRAQRRF